MKPVILIHGGAGTILRQEMTEEKEAVYLKALRDALTSGFSILEKGGSAVDAVEAAVISMEDFPLFNAGRGSVFNAEGKHEMDAAIMNGSDLSAGAVAGISHIKNPVRLAKAVMQHSQHVLLSGSGAEAFAKSQGLAFEDEAYFFDEYRYQQWKKMQDSDEYSLDHASRKAPDKTGTVGAVALDANGNLAAATSTGGMTNKRYGRIGDSPLIGAGTYANNKTCAVSCTGHGELFIRSVVAYDISCLMEYRGWSLAQACEVVVNQKLLSIGGEGGLIAIDGNGNFSMPFNSEGMYRGWMTNGNHDVSIFRHE